MRVLLDTNIVIHREATSRAINKDIGVLFKWLDDLHYAKCVHQVTIAEINKLKAEDTRLIFNIKLDSYNILKVQSPLHPAVLSISNELDINDNDQNDTILLNEVYNERVDILITEDKKIHKKAALLKIADRVFTIDSFLEKVTAEHPDLADYKVLSVKKELFGNVNINDPFFASFLEDYPGFDKWFNRKSEEVSYICVSQDGITAFLYLKIEDENEPYSDIFPRFSRKKRLKIGTFKVTLNGFKLGERFLKIIFDNAIRYHVDEIYVTIFDKRLEQQRLINLLEDFGFTHHGLKTNEYGDELVYVRSMARTIDVENPKITYPYISKGARAFIVPIYPEYHTNLFPDSILRTESPSDFVEHEPFRNSISKVYISRSHLRSLQTGDVIVFYRTGGYYQSVVTTLGVVEKTVLGITDPQQFISLCRKRSVFSDAELLSHWNYSERNKPFVVNFLYDYSFPKRINMKRLIELGIISNVQSAPRGFERITAEHFALLLKETETDDYIIVD